ncbi:MAG: LPS export ABC transporter periplasmic protein LptC [Pseudomonadota bacterium]
MLILLAIAATLLLLSSWLTQREQAPQSSPEASDARLPDYFIRGLEATVTDATGHPSHRLSAASLTHYPADDTTELEQLELTVYTERQPHWHLIADHATGDAGQQLLLQGTVTLQQQRDEGMTLLTEQLLIDTERRYAESSAAVTLQGDSFRLQGIGLEAFAEPQRLRLLSQVRGDYAAP